MQIIDLREPIDAIAHHFELIKNEIDYFDFERTFSGRLTKARYKAIDRYCRHNTIRFRCHHEHDCCGCITAQYMSFAYKHNQVVVSLSKHYNY